MVGVEDRREATLLSNSLFPPKSNVDTDEPQALA